MQDFSGEGAQLKSFLDLGSACRELLLWGFGGMHPQENGAILCVLRAIFNHFHDKKSSQKL